MIWQEQRREFSGWEASIFWMTRANLVKIFPRTRAPAWPVTETGQVLGERRGGTGPESGIGDAVKGGRGNGWSAIWTTQESMPDGPLAEGEVSRAWVNAASAARKAKPVADWQ